MTMKMSCKLNRNFVRNREE